MTFSDAIPIQFWDIDQNTFNESENCGMTDACFCQEWEINDPILIQFQDSSGYTFYLTVLYDDGSLSTPVAFTKSGTTYSINADATSLSITYTKRFSYLISRGSPVTLNTYTVLAPSAWTDGSGIFDSKTATEFIENSLNASKNAYLTIDAPAGIRVTLSYIITIAGAFSGTVIVRTYLWNSSSSSIVSESVNDFQTDFTTAGPHTITAALEATDDADRIYMEVSFDGLTGTPNVTIDISGSLGAVIVVGGLEKKSDCQRFYQDSDGDPASSNCSELITYSNDSNAFDLDYESGSPSAEFNIRIPARFFHESFPQEEEVHELSTDEQVNIWSKLERKKLLEVGYVPYYMHKKIQMILMHDNIAIGQEYWVRKDPYQITEGNKRYPIKMATIQLTDKDTIERNLI